MSISPEDVKNYYTLKSLKDKIDSALSEQGKSLNEITIDDLAVVDEFHVRGQAATNELIQARV